MDKKEKIKEYKTKINSLKQYICTMEKEKKAQPNVVLTMPEAEKKIARQRSIEIYDDYRSLSKYIRDLIAYDAKHKIL